MWVDLMLNGTVIFGNITISVMFLHDFHDYYWDVYVHGYPFWTTNLVFLSKVILVQQSLTSWEVFVPELLLEYWIKLIYFVV